jgi:acetyltransferase
MNKFFDIDSVAVVWASENEEKLSNNFLKVLKSFSWNKYWVNPKWWGFEGIKFYKSISLLPEVVDILVFVIPASLIPDSLLEVAKVWIKRVIIISAWFKDAWNYELEEKIKEIASKNDIMLLGPNCLWYVDTFKSLNLSFWTKEVNRWNISIISQSGAIAVAITDWALNHNLGFSKVITLGNKAWLDEVDFLLELENDENTKIIALYLENVWKSEKFFEIVNRLWKIKPIILLKSGTSKAGKMAASSHTWTSSSDKDVFFTQLENSLIHHTDSFEDFFLWIEIFSKTYWKITPNELVIITNAWWPWVFATDCAEKYGVKLTTFTETEKSILKNSFSDFSSFLNPVDILWDATSKSYLQILNNFKELKEKRAILILLTPQSMTDVENVAEVISSFKKENPNEFIFTSFIGWRWVEVWKKILQDNLILNYDEPWKAIKAFSELIKV